MSREPDGGTPAPGSTALDPTFTTAAMASAFSPAERVQALLRFEAALARAEARAGVIAKGAADAIAAACEEASFDADELHQEGARAGTLVIPLVRRLTDAVPESARGWVHLGATSQDALDTAAMLQARRGLDLLVEDLRGVGMACRRLAESYAATPMAGRTLLQQASPVTFGLKAARWLGLATRQLERLLDLGSRLPVQLGGPSGTLAALGANGPRVTELLAEELDLAVPDLPWHAERDLVAHLASTLAVTAGAMAKVALDVALLMQTEVAEVQEVPPEGEGGSSAMPHKRNPVRATSVIAASRLAAAAASVVLTGMAQEHERAAGAWQAEWIALPDAFRATGGAVANAREMLETLRVDPDRMRRNLGQEGSLPMTEGLVTALVPHLGREEAYAVVRDVARRAAETSSFEALAREDPAIAEVLSTEEVAAALDPSAFLGGAVTFIERAVRRFDDVVGPSEGS
jgi:3-carboxy-cis,cis-muconate cycloisomerase